MNIRRIGTAAGRWPRYNLIVDGIDVGSVRRTISRGCDRLHPQGGSTHDGWRIHGVVCESREIAERMLIERAVALHHLRPGHLALWNANLLTVHRQEANHE